MITIADFSVLHTQFWYLCEEDPLIITIHHPELIMLKKISYKVIETEVPWKKCNTLNKKKYIYISFKNT